jgi:hypothetical protein
MKLKRKSHTRSQNLKINIPFMLGTYEATLPSLCLMFATMVKVSIHEPLRLNLGFKGL